MLDENVSPAADQSDSRAVGQPLHWASFLGSLEATRGYCGSGANGSACQIHALDFSDTRLRQQEGRKPTEVTVVMEQTAPLVALNLAIKLSIEINTLCHTYTRGNITMMEQSSP
eukprot:1157626-Pelagomonas_calceolata.AAC.30